MYCTAFQFSLMFYGLEILINAVVLSNFGYNMKLLSLKTKCNTFVGFVNIYLTFGQKHPSVFQSEKVLLFFLQNIPFSVCVEIVPSNSNTVVTNKFTTVQHSLFGHVQFK